MAKKVRRASRTSTERDLSLGDGPNVDHGQSEPCSEEEDEERDSSPQSEEALSTHP